jgi:sensor c-di-GMP phosphodiesterase-like protein
LDRRTLWIVTLLAMLLAIAGPILLALHLARREALADHTARALGHARDLLARAEADADQLDAVFSALALAAPAEACTPERRALLRRLELGAGRIALLGQVAGDTVACYPAQQDGETLALGPAGAPQPNGDRLRFDVALPGVPAARFLVVERAGHAAFVAQDGTLGLSSTDDDTVLALLAGAERRVLAARGEFRPEWIAALGAQPEATVLEADRIVALAASPRHSLAAVAALPTASLGRRVATMALLVVPAGIVAGLVMILAVYHESKARLAMPAVIRAALRRGEFFLDYQPVIELATRRWIGAEALIRWQRSSGEIMQPNLFLAAAEDAGLIQCITRRVFELVARDAAGLFEQHPGFHLALNLSAADLYDEGTLTQLRALAGQLHARPGNLVIEATERGFANPRLAGLVVEKLFSAGIRVAIDDFGTGHAGLAQLQHVKVDFLKIDRSFVETIGTDAATSDVVAHIIQIARTLKLELIAEGVETEEQAGFLRERGVRYAQGWLFARPLSLAELRERLARQAREATG